MAEHELKTWPELFEAVKEGRKNFDVRKNDRGFQTGDILIFKKWNPAIIFQDHVVGYDQHEPPLRMRVKYILSGFGIENGYVVMGLASAYTEEQARNGVTR